MRGFTVLYLLFMDHNMLLNYSYKPIKSAHVHIWQDIANSQLQLCILHLVNPSRDNVAGVGTV